tara:strand:+ start:790 stop:1005 length:216 start_codon:yes stop_codon:yes gene_type:complete
MFKFCSSSALVGWQGQTLHLRAGSVWRADDPFVKAHPDMFSDAPDVLESSSGVTYRPVEQATAAPGEKRAR